MLQRIGPGQGTASRTLPRPSPGNAKWSFEYRSSTVLAYWFAQCRQCTNIVGKYTEWIGTDLIFEVAEKGDETKIHFTHVGLVPDYECFDICSNEWSRYVNGSLRSLITTGKGQPNEKESGR